MRGHIYRMMALIPKSYKLLTRAWAKPTGRSLWKTIAFESIQANLIFEELVVAKVAEVAVLLVEQGGERRPKSNDLSGYSKRMGLVLLTCATEKVGSDHL